jgi:hypothetical protein
MTAEQLLCAATARWLGAGNAVAGALGLVAVLLAGLLLLARAPLPGLAAAALLLAPAERALALRTRFDAGLFSDLARQPVPALALLDAALAGLRLRQAAAAPQAPRPLAERVAGARRLTWQHIGLALAQFGAVGLELLVLAWGFKP